MAPTLVNVSLVVASLAIGQVFAGVINPPHSKTCRNIPGDTRWPRPEAWDRLNATVGGRLTATVPIAHVCHDPFFSPDECAQVRGQWNTANVMYASARLTVISHFSDTHAHASLTPLEETRC